MKMDYGAGTITPEELVKSLAVTGQLAHLCREAILRKEVRKAAGTAGLSVSDEEVQEFADAFRKMMDLHDAADTVQFLENAGLSEDDFGDYCETCCLADALRDHLATDAKIQEYFLNNRIDFERARVSIIGVEDENLAKELVVQVEEEGEDFHALAREHSLDQRSKYGGGHLGLLPRRALNQEQSAKVFNASPGDVLGPFALEKGFCIVLVEELHKAEMNELIGEAIKQTIFDQWLNDRMKEGVKVKV